MKIIKKIKSFLGLELPYLLEEEEAEIKNNVLKEKESHYESKNLTKTIDQLSQAMITGSITANEARELLNIGRK